MFQGKSYIIHHYKKIDSKTRKITQLCQLNLLSIDYATNLEKCTNWYTLKKWKFLDSSHLDLRILLYNLNPA